MAADVLVQEYGRYFGMKTACFRGGCLTGPNHSRRAAARLPRLSDASASSTGMPYTVFGYKGKQVRDNIHSADLRHRVRRRSSARRACGEVYNIGGGRFCNCSMLEAIALCEEIAGKRLAVAVRRDAPHRAITSGGSATRRSSAAHIPSWDSKFDLRATLEQMVEQPVHVAGLRWACMALEANLREMERSREAYWRRFPATSPVKLRWRALTVRHCFHVLPGEVDSRDSARAAACGPST